MGKSILFLHGLGGSGDDWNHAIPAFEADGWRCEAPTLFQHLRTRQNPPEALNSLGFNDWVKAASAYVEQLTNEEGEKPLVIGHCIGGLIAQKLVEFDEVAGGVFISPSPDETHHEIGNSLSKSLSFSAFLLTMRAANSPFRSIGLNWGMLNNVPSVDRTKIIENMRYESSRLVAELARPASIAGHTARVNTLDVQRPTMTIACGKDRTVSKHTVELCASAWDNAPNKSTFKAYPQLGHRAPNEFGSNELFADILTWTNDVQRIPSRSTTPQAFEAKPIHSAKIISLSAA